MQPVVAALISFVFQVIIFQVILTNRTLQVGAPLVAATYSTSVSFSKIPGHKLTGPSAAFFSFSVHVTKV